MSDYLSRLVDRNIGAGPPPEALRPRPVFMFEPQFVLDRSPGEMPGAAVPEAEAEGTIRPPVEATHSRGAPAPWMSLPQPSEAEPARASMERETRLDPRPVVENTAAGAARDVLTPSEHVPGAAGVRAAHASPDPHTLVEDVEISGHRTAETPLPSRGSPLAPATAAAPADPTSPSRASAPAAAAPAPLVPQTGLPRVSAAIARRPDAAHRAEGVPRPPADSDGREGIVPAARAGAVEVIAPVSSHVPPLAAPDGPIVRPSEIAVPSVQPAPSAAQAPTIRVTIGRVDVRAVHPPARQAPNAVPDRRGPALSLDAYLKQRNRGQR